MTRHRIMKWAKLWYALCGECARTLGCQTWGQVCQGLERHVREEHVSVR